MPSTSDPLITAIVEASGPRLPAVAGAFAVLFRESWPEVKGAAALQAVLPSTSPAQIAEVLQRAFDEAHELFPTVAFWWKDSDSTFLGCCARLGPAAGLPSSVDLIGKNDVHPSVAWNRQGNLYRRDDRSVVDAFVPKLNIVERQDRSDGTVWLRTSKVPYRSAAGEGSVGGFDIISEARALQLRALAGS
jgi:hypothetical protein